MRAGVIGSAGSWGLYFFFYERAKSRHSSATSQSQLSSVHHMLAALEASAITLLFTNPFWLVKTRMQLQLQQAPGNYRSVTHAITTILKTDGVMGLYKGMLPALALTSHGAVQFAVYERLKLWCKTRDITAVR